MSSPPPIHGGNVAQEAQRLGCDPNDLLDASASLVPFAVPKSLKSCLKQALHSSHLRDYPDRNYEELRKAIASWHGINPNFVLPGNGAAELFTWAARDAAREGLSGLPSPGFADYKRALRCWHGTYQNEELPLSWPEEFPQHFPINPKTEVLWITNPHNPTGQLWSKQSIIPLVEKYKLVICDEAFLPLAPVGEKQSLIPFAEMCPNLIVIRSLTKLFGIAGLRLGYVVSNEKRLNHWREYRDPWPVNGLAMAAGEMLMKDTAGLQKWLKKVHNWVLHEGNWCQHKFKQIPGITPHPSSTNFFLIESQHSLVSIREELAQRHILLRDCRSFAKLGGNWLRVSLQNRKGNNKIHKALRSLLT